MNKTVTGLSWGMRTLQVTCRLDCSGEVWDSHTLGCDDYCFLWCDMVQFVRYIPIYQGNMLFPTSDPL